MTKSVEELQLDLENLLLIHGDQHDSVARLYNDMAKAYFRDDDYNHALEYYGKAAELTQQLHGEQDEYLIDIHYRYLLDHSYVTIISKTYCRLTCFYVFF